VIVPDPVGGGFVDNLARPGGNATGFLQFEYGLGWNCSNKLPRV
jgi:putative ABC transport system substrate-binding protein